MGMEVIQSGDFKVETSLAEDFSPKSHEHLVLCAALTQGLNSENGNLLPETRSILQPLQNGQQTVQWLHVKIHDNLLFRLASGFSISC